MEKIVKLVQIMSEYSKDIHIDYDRETVLFFLNKKFLQDFLVKIDKLPFEIVFKLDMDNKLICIVLGVDYMLYDMEEGVDD